MVIHTLLNLIKLRWGSENKNRAGIAGAVKILLLTAHCFDATSMMDLIFIAMYTCTTSQYLSLTLVKMLYMLLSP